MNADESDWKGTVGCATALVVAAILGVLVLWTWVQPLVVGKTLETVESPSPDGALRARLNRISRGVTGGHCEVLVEDRFGNDNAQVAWGDYGVGLELSWTNPRTLRIRLARNEKITVGKDVTAGECQVGTQRVNIRFEFDDSSSVRTKPK